MGQFEDNFYRGNGGGVPPRAALAATGLGWFCFRKTSPETRVTHELRRGGIYSRIIILNQH